ncbi:MAG: hypothetical protein ACYC4K_02945 [Thiobacillus sp.]
MQYLMLIGSLVLLTGCALDPKEREARESAHFLELARVCERVGYATGSEQNKDCVVKLLAAERTPPPVVNAPYPMFCHTLGSMLICP